MTNSRFKIHTQRFRPSRPSEPTGSLRFALLPGGLQLSTGDTSYERQP
jgi:hypothetical protein